MVLDGGKYRPQRPSKHEDLHVEAEAQHEPREPIVT